MCGRTVCSLAPGHIQRACRYRDRNGQQREPDWKDAPSGKQYYPSHNIAPGSHTPVLLSSHHFPDARERTRHIIQPMHWGLIPSWHKGKMSEKAFETNNCRAESMLEKMTYKMPLQKGRRCVILAEGFFEWKRSKDVKQPYYIYFPQHVDSNGNLSSDTIGKGNVEVEVKVKDENSIKEEVKCPQEDELEERTVPSVKEEIFDVTVSCDDQDSRISSQDTNSWAGQMLDTEVDDSEDYCGPRLLTMAGVFDIWTPPDGGEPVYSYSVITVDSSPAMAWIHHRMPAILTTDEEVDAWLDSGNVPLNKAVKLVRPVTCLQSHPVSTVVNNSRHKTPDCVKPVDLSKPKKPVNSLMMSWLSRGKQKASETDTTEQDGKPPDKKQKLA